jgi:hypothetical protein
MGDVGSNIWIGAAIFFMAFMTVVVLIEPMKDGINIARDTTHLDCHNTSISTGQKMTCIVVDGTLPYFVLMTLGAGFAFMFASKQQNNPGQ